MNSVTTVTQSFDPDTGRIVHTVTNNSAKGLTASQQKMAERLLGREVRLPQHENRLPKSPKAPKSTGNAATDAANKAKHEQACSDFNDRRKGIVRDQDGNIVEESRKHHGEPEGIRATQGHENREQATSSSAGHGGAACTHCHPTQHANGVRNVTGAQEEAGGHGRTQPLRDPTLQADRAAQKAEQAESDAKDAADKATTAEKEAAKAKRPDTIKKRTEEAERAREAANQAAQDAQRAREAANKT